MSTFAVNDILTAQERQIMDLLYANPGLTVAEINQCLDGSTYASIRAALYRLVNKGQLRAERDGVRHLYTPAVDPYAAGRTAIKRVMDTFFGGSPASTINAVLGFSKDKLSGEELAELKRLIDAKSGSGRRGPRS